MPSWVRGFINVVHALREGHKIDRTIAANITVEAKVAKNNRETQSNNSAGTIVLFWEDTSGAHTPIDEEAA